MSNFNTEKVIKRLEGYEAEINSNIPFEKKIELYDELVIYTLAISDLIDNETVTYYLIGYRLRILEDINRSMRSDDVS